MREEGKRCHPRTLDIIRKNLRNQLGLRPALKGWRVNWRARSLSEKLGCPIDNIEGGDASEFAGVVSYQSGS